MQDEDRLSCRECGHERDPGARYCASCGAAHATSWPSSDPSAVTVARPASGPDHTQTNGDPGRPGGRRRTVVLSAVGLALVFAVALLVTLQVAGDGPGARDRSGQAATDGSSRSGGDGSDDERRRVGRGPAAPTETSPEPSEAESSSTGDEDAALCWDGSTASAVAACSLPTGDAGLDWVFPDKAVQACEPGDPQAARVTWVTCQVVLPSGSTVMVNYTQWVSSEAAVSYYTDLNVTGPLYRDAMQGWYIEARRPNPPFKAALLYDGGPYSVTYYGFSPAERDTALRTVSLRPPAELRGVPSGG